jgi:hypothetical protein
LFNKNLGKNFYNVAGQSACLWQISGSVGQLVTLPVSQPIGCLVKDAISKII